MANVIIGTGSAMPGQRMTNDDLEAASADWDRARSGVTLDEWVSSRMGIRERRRARPDEGTGHLAQAAVEAALDNAGLAPEDLDLIVLSTFTSDHRQPSSVNLVQERLGIPAKCIQLESACGGFLDNVLTTNALLASGQYETAVCVHAETTSAIINPEKFLMQAIFGDGAGAAVLRAEPGTTDEGLLGVCSFTDTTEGKSHWIRAGGGTLSPITADRLTDGTHFLEIEYKSIYGYAVEKMTRSVLMLTEEAGVDLDEIDWVVAHQTGVNIIHAVAERLGMPKEKFLLTIERTGNTSGATIPIALDEHHRSGEIQPGDLVVMPAVGAGMVWGAILTRWVDVAARRAARLAARDEPTIDLRDHVPAPTGPGAPVTAGPTPTGAAS